MLAGKSVSQFTYFVSSATLNRNNSQQISSRLYHQSRDILDFVDEGVSAPVALCGGSAGPRSSADDATQPGRRGRRGGGGGGVRATDDATSLGRLAVVVVVVVVAAAAVPPAPSTDQHSEQTADHHQRRQRTAGPHYRQTDIYN